MCINFEQKNEVDFFLSEEVNQDLMDIPFVNGKICSVLQDNYSIETTYQLFSLFLKELKPGITNEKICLIMRKKIPYVYYLLDYNDLYEDFILCICKKICILFPSSIIILE